MWEGSVGGKRSCIGGPFSGFFNAPCHAYAAFYVTRPTCARGKTIRPVLSTHEDKSDALRRLESSKTVMFDLSYASPEIDKQEEVDVRIAKRLE
jgi:hypothetical protein